MPRRAPHLADCIGMLQGTAGALELLRELVRLPAATLSADDAQALGALSRVLQHAAVQLQAEFALAGRVDYTYVTAAARESLGSRAEPTDLALRTGLSLRHILVDEFQDTSLAQFELLEVLTAGWEEGDGRTLFVVGDPMQSIYRFRDAEVGLFLAARERGVAEVQLDGAAPDAQLSRRPGTGELDQRGVRAGLSARTTTCAPGRSPTATAPRRVRAPPPAPACGCGSFRKTAPGEARALAAHVHALRSADPAASVAVLVAAHAARHADRERARARSASSPSESTWCRSPSAPIVRDLVQLARALLRPRRPQPRGWPCCARPWCGARLATLTALSRRDGPPADLGGAASSRERLARCAAA